MPIAKPIPDPVELQDHWILIIEKVDLQGEVSIDLGSEAGLGVFLARKKPDLL